MVPSHELLLSQEINSLLRNGAIESVPDQHKGRGFYSRYFLMPKENGDWRSILDLGLLNKCVSSQKLRVVTLTTIIPALSSANWFSGLDLQDEYFHIAIHLWLVAALSGDRNIPVP